MHSNKKEVRHTNMNKEDNRLLAEFYNLPVKQLMHDKTWDIPMVSRDEPVSHILSILDGKSHVWVVNNLEEKELLGVITHHDVLHILSPRKRFDSLFGLPQLFHHGTTGTAEDIMTASPIQCSPDGTITDVLRKMTRHKIRRLPVVEDGKLKSEITIQHLIHKYYKASQYHPI